MQLKYLLLLVLGTIGFAACKNKNLHEAVIVATGDITYEGCGYLLKLEDGQLLKPSYLPGAFQHPNIVVYVDYSHTGIVDTCDYSLKLFDLVNINEIHLKNDK